MVPVAFQRCIYGFQEVIINSVRICFKKCLLRDDAGAAPGPRDFVCAHTTRSLGRVCLVLSSSKVFLLQNFVAVLAERPECENASVATVGNHAVGVEDTHDALLREIAVLILL